MDFSTHDLDNAGAAAEHNARPVNVVRESGAEKEKKNSEIKHKSNSVHRGPRRAQLLHGKFEEYFLSFCLLLLESCTHTVQLVLLHDF